MNLYTLFHDRVAAALAHIVAQGRLPADLDLSHFVVEPPRDPAHGDLAVNAAMVYAKEAKAAGFGNPRQLAVEIAAALAGEDDVDQAEVAGPGFINVRLQPHVFQGVLRAALSDPAAFAHGGVAAGAPVNVEYVSANPTGPMHVGHGRGAVFATRWPVSSPSSVGRSPRNITSTTPARRSTSSAARRCSDTARRWARRSTPKPSITPATTSCPSARRWRRAGARH